MRNIKLEKKKLREQVEEKIHLITKTEMIVSDTSILQKILSLPEYQKAKSVFCFVGTEGEIDTRPLILHALQSQKKVAVPLCISRGVMEARLITSLSDLKPGRYGIPEPNSTCPVLPPEEIDLAIVPCVSCDIEGNRLGHGAGFYDRYLVNTHCIKAALCREKLLCNQVPTTDNDIKMDMVITEQKIF